MTATAKTTTAVRQRWAKVAEDAKAETTAVETASQALRRLAADHADFDQVWEFFKDQPELLRYVLREKYGKVCRQRTEAAEYKAFTGRVGGGPQGNRGEVGEFSIREIVAELSDEGFQVDGRQVSWLDATVEDHEMRAAYQEKLANGHLMTAERHRMAAKAIREAGVTCLRDLAGGVV